MAATKTNLSSRTITETTYFVFYGDHDKGSPAGFMVRDGFETAQRSAKLMSECGYQTVEIKFGIDLIFA